MILAGSVMALIAFFVPWLSLPIIGTATGMQLAVGRSDDAVLFALPAVAILLLILAYARSVARLETSIWQFLLGAAGGVSTAAIISNLMAQLANLPFDLGLLGRVNPGAWLSFVGFLLAAMGGLMQLHEERAADPLMYWYMPSGAAPVSEAPAAAHPSPEEPPLAATTQPAAAASFSWTRIDQ